MRKIIDEFLDLGFINCWRKRRFGVEGISLRWSLDIKERC